MSNTKTDRVLGRMCARELTSLEMEAISGGIVFPKCTFNPVTCVIDGQCSPEPNC